MRRSAFPCVHHSFMVRVLAPLKHQARERQMTLQHYLRQGVETMLQKGNPRAERESWQRALAVLAHETGMPQPVAREFGRQYDS